MKVCRKRESSAEYEVIDESSKYYIVKDGCGKSIALDKNEWGPAMQWHDKTAEYDGMQAKYALTSNPDQYRLVQHKVDDLHNKYTYMAYTLEWNGGTK